MPGVSLRYADAESFEVLSESIAFIPAFSFTKNGETLQVIYGAMGRYDFEHKTRSIFEGAV
jgi:hypothetical protein